MKPPAPNLPQPRPLREGCEEIHICFSCPFPTLELPRAPHCLPGKILSLELCKCEPLSTKTTLTFQQEHQEDFVVVVVRCYYFHHPDLAHTVVHAGSLSTQEAEAEGSLEPRCLKPAMW